MDERNSDSGVISFLVGMGIGATAAAIAALLYAPRAGAETRQSVADAVKELHERTDELAERVRGAIHEVGERVSQDLDAAVTAAKEAAAQRRAELERTAKAE